LQRTIEDVWKAYGISTPYTPSISAYSNSEGKHKASPTPKSRSRAASRLDETNIPARNVHLVYTTAGDEKIITADLEASGYTLISYKGATNGRASLREDWEMLITIEPSIFAWKYKTSESLYRRDDTRRAGNIALNSNSRNQDITTSGALVRFMSVYYVGDEITLKGESAFRTVVSCRIADLISTDSIPAYWCALSYRSLMKANPL
jgi:hypothetical protein